MITSTTSPTGASCRSGSLRRSIRDDSSPPRPGCSSWTTRASAAGSGKRLEDAGTLGASASSKADNFRKRSENEYSLAPELGREGYEALIKDLAAHGRSPSRVVHLWLTTDRERFRPGSSFFHENLQNGFFSLFFLARALADENLPGDVHVTVVSNGMQQVVAGDGPLYPEKATVLGPVEVIPREIPGVTCKSIDVTLPVAPPPVLAPRAARTARRRDRQAREPRRGRRSARGGAAGAAASRAWSRSAVPIGTSVDSSHGRCANASTASATRPRRRAGPI